MEKASLETKVPTAKNTASRVGKEIICPRCHRPGVLKLKEIPRKESVYHALYVYHYDRMAKRIKWHYYGKLGGDQRF